MGSSLARVHPSLFLDVFRDTPFYYKLNLQENLDTKQRYFHIIKHMLARWSGIPHIKQVMANLWRARTEFKHQKKRVWRSPLLTLRSAVLFYFSPELAQALGAGPKAVCAAQEEDEWAAGRKHPQCLSSGFTTRLQGALKGTGVRSFVLLTKDRGCGFGFSSHCLPVLPLSAGLIDSVVSQAGGACSLPRGKARKPTPLHF